MDSGRNSIFAKHGTSSPKKKYMDPECSIEEFDHLLQGSKFDKKTPGSSLSFHKGGRFYKPGVVPLITVVDDEIRSGTAGNI